MAQIDLSPYYLFVQFIGFLGTGLFFASFQCRENRNLFKVQFFSYLLYTTHFLLLGAITGGVSYMINCLRSYCLSSNLKFAKGKLMCAVLCFMQVSVLWLTWCGWISLLPIIANIASTIGGYTKNPQKVRIAGMFVNSPLWIIYNVIVDSWAGIVDEIVSEVSMLISVMRFGWKNLDRVEE